MQIPTNAKTVIADAVEAKLATLDTAKAAFNTAMELYSAGNDKSLEADEYADNGARALFQMQTGGLITKARCSGSSDFRLPERRRLSDFLGRGGRG